MTAAFLDLSVVLYHPDPDLLARSLDTIGAAADRLADGTGVQTRLWIIDNGAPEGSDQAPTRSGRCWTAMRKPAGRR
ncbi:hypothetical protein [Azospirillum sp. INR13]|uniref:hypothetical protein n=1 Tax=Azospirillum sp. INR13 TaxID=2596919 RepID=UPI002104E80D|nr:hypothetical protein [Azospirillum sp. INR13]